MRSKKIIRVLALKTYSYITSSEVQAPVKQIQKFCSHVLCGLSTPYDSIAIHP